MFLCVMVYIMEKKALISDLTGELSICLVSDRHSRDVQNIDLLSFV